MIRVRSYFVLTSAAFALALSLATAASGATKYPTVSKVTPLSVGIGGTLTIYGKGFRAGNKKNTVVFRNGNGRTVFAKAGKSTTTRITIVIPVKLMPYMTTKGNGIEPTKFRIRIVSTKLGKTYTASSKSPTIGPIGYGKSAGSSSDCDNDGIPNSSETDRDNDVISDTLETNIHTDKCDSDSDGDGVIDGYEYYSALDYNSLALPYPGKRPYPNALDGSDANTDYDSDVLTLTEEYIAWLYGGRQFPLNYSDGNQWTGGKTPAAQAAIHGSGSRDLDGSGTISDNEKDVDNDGLENFSEAHGPMSSPGWWDAIFGTAANNSCGATESAYPGISYQGTNFADTDTDGDTLADGPDDVDHDGYSNAFETYRPTNWCRDYVSISHDGTANGGIPDPLARVQPFNPCKPIYSDMCHQHPPIGYYKQGEDWESPYHGTFP